MFISVWIAVGIICLPVYLAYDVIIFTGSPTRGRKGRNAIFHPSNLIHKIFLQYTHHNHCRLAETRRYEFISCSYAYVTCCTIMCVFLRYASNNSADLWERWYILWLLIKNAISRKHPWSGNIFIKLLSYAMTQAPNPVECKNIKQILPKNQCRRMLLRFAFLSHRFDRIVGPRQRQW